MKVAVKSTKLRKKGKRKKAVRLQSSVVTAALSFVNGAYQLDWKTDKAWANTCRRLTLRLVDNHSYTADVLFKP